MLQNLTGLETSPEGRRQQSHENKCKVKIHSTSRFKITNSMQHTVLPFIPRTKKVRFMILESPHNPSSFN